jgi:dCTP diphosphatase
VARVDAAPPDPLTELRDALRAFASERDWDKYHSPKNLASALSVEAAELLEHFQWMSEDESRSLAPAQLEAVGHELADVLLYLIRLADRLGVDLAAAAHAKIALNARKYPVERSRGSRRKYTDL